MAQSFLLALIGMHSKLINFKDCYNVFVLSCDMMLARV